MKKFLNFKIDRGLLHSISYVASITSCILILSTFNTLALGFQRNQFILLAYKKNIGDLCFF